jgi:hypothetical protein
METGYSKPVQCLTINVVPHIYAVLTIFHCIIKIKAEIDQFVDGLNTLDIVNTIKSIQIK